MSEPTSNPNVWAVIIAIVTTLGGSKIWELLQKRLELSREERESDKKGEIAYRDDLMKRISTLEESLSESIEERIELLNRITTVSNELARLEVKVEYLEAENTRLKSELSHLKSGQPQD